MTGLLDWLPWGTTVEEERTVRKRLLHEVLWDEEVEETYTVETVRLVWSGGAEKEVTHEPGKRHHIGQREYWGVDGELVLEVEEQPAYREVLSEIEETRTVTKRRKAWASVGTPPNLPDGVEPTGKTKVVEERIEG